MQHDTNQDKIKIPLNSLISNHNVTIERYINMLYALIIQGLYNLCI